jgi:hypothetical protein
MGFKYYTLNCIVLKNKRHFSYAKLRKDMSFKADFLIKRQSKQSIANKIT